MPARLVVLLSLLSTLVVPSLPAQAPDRSLLTVERIYASADFRPERFGPARWLAGGTAYTTLEPSPGRRGAQDIVRYDVGTGAREVLVPAARLVPEGDSTALAIEDYAWSADQARLLIFTNSKQVWRTNTRGDYWVLDLKTWRLRRLGGPEAKPSTLMFAKFSPDGGRVGYVRENDLYVEDLATGAITRLTTDGSRTVINGTFDWVYEEELGLRDGWRWSPDGRRIAYWQLDAERVRDFLLVNNTDSLYSFTVPIQYPKAGETNSAARVGVVSATGGETRWVRLPGDPRNNYPARMDWAASPDELVIQYLNRLQNRLELFLADAATGAVRTVLTERDSAWVEVVDDLVWLDGGKRFTWVSERDGWTHVYVVSRDGKSVRLVTPGEFDVAQVLGVDEKGGWLYYVASPETPTQRYLFRARLDGKGKPERLSPATEPGSHAYDLSPSYRYAFHTYSRFDTPPVSRLVRLPGHQVVRTLVENRALRENVAALRKARSEFFQVDVGNGIQLNGWIMKPADFDSTRKYPILFHVYGGPGSQTVLDQWGGSQYLWHTLLTQRGILVASVDNRGTGLRGRDWRKIVYGRLGVVETQDQAAAARAIGRWAYVDSTRMAIWGWSYGGFMSLNGILQFPGVYRAAMAVAPVTHWKYYDTIYTERYNGLPHENRDGYDRGSPLTYADSLRGELLVVHGTGDDNVHVQNTEALVNALVKANKQFDLMLYPNRNHGIYGGNTTVHLRNLLADYITQRLTAGAERPRVTSAAD
ncbi:MAG TPA: S9 family peptidase [Gemmatimonadales bacterium]|nr:S9 family peptidase [Gemmatimonadales bacterium]